MIASFGTWDSPITAEKIAEGSTTITQLEVDNESTYWTEIRPTNRGRSTIVKRDPNGETKDMTPPEFNVRTFVHEYGGGAFTVSNGVVYASNAADHKIYAIVPNEAPKALTKDSDTRFADMVVTDHGIIAVAEHHDSQKVTNYLALVSPITGDFKQLTGGYDFYASPAISPSGKKIAWLCWNHPEMPWTHNELWIADIGADGTLSNLSRIAGDIDEASFQPQWYDDNTLYFVTDRDKGWWNLHRWSEGKLENVCPIEAEVGLPLWNFRMSTWTFLGRDILFTYNKDGIWKLGLLNPQTKQWKKIDREGISYSQIRGHNNFARMIEVYPNKPEAVIEIDSSLNVKILAEESNQALDQKYVSLPQHISFPSRGETAYAFYYPPKNGDFTPPNGEKPPLVVMIHGGPTAQSGGSYSQKKLFWTTRGFAILDVNYAGSTGYGRNYRQALDRLWGIADVEDCINGAKFLADQGLVDVEKLVIRGGSAGGYTTLAALAFSNVFKAGASYYGVADLVALANDTHKFEARYLDGLLGKFPEEKELWVNRSPIHAVDQIKAPLILFQGEEDKVVPKNQAEMIYQAVREKGIKTELYIYPEEDHGFRQAKYIAHSLKREVEFYCEVFGLIDGQ